MPSLLTDDDALKRLGMSIRSWRDTRGLTQTELAKLIGSTQTHVSNIESGKSETGVLIICRISQALKVPVSMLFEE